MALLVLFGFIAGAATALSPCVLPVLPIALSAGATGGRRRPLGIVAGLTISFTFATVALVYVISALGLPDDLLRKLAITVLIALGLTLMAPPLAARLEGRLSRLASRGGGPRSGGDGFWSGILVGLSLGLVYAPCAGPILAGVITVSASQSFGAGRLAVALSYGLGSAVVLYFLMLGGRRAIAPLAKRGAGLQVAMGAVMVVVGLAMLGNYDIRFQNAIAGDLPSFLVNPSGSLEDSAQAQDALAELRGAGHGVKFAAAGAPPESKGEGLDLPVLGRAPEFVGNEHWFNTPGDRPLTLRGLRGRVVLVDFWTYSCINCIRTFPYLKAWDARYRKDGLTIVGVHTPEFPFERDPGNVEDAIKRNDIRYPVAQDNEQQTWNAYANQYWPAEYFVDARGRVRYVHFGEGEYEEKEEVIRALLAEAGHEVGKRMADGHGIEPEAGVTTPESYLGAARALRFVNGSIAPGLHDYTAPAGPPPPNLLAYRGPWRVELDSATAAGGSLELNFGARHVYLVLGTVDGKPRRVKVLLDGKPIGAGAGADVHGGAVTVRSQRLYDLVDLPAVGNHVLRLVPETGVMGYAFTFG